MPFNINDHLTTLPHQSGVYIDNNPAADNESSNMKRRKCNLSSEILADIYQEREIFC